MNQAMHNRLNRIIGQLQGIQKMIDTDQDCEKIAIQFKAVKSSMDSAFRDFVYNNATNCPQNKPERLKKMLKMMM